MLKLTRAQHTAIDRAIRTINEELNVCITPINCPMDDDEPLVFGVNWKAMGGVSADSAEEYGKGILKASNIAKFLTSLELVYTYDGDVKGNPDERAKLISSLVHELGQADPFPEYIIDIIEKIR